MRTQRLRLLLSCAALVMLAICIDLVIATKKHASSATANGALPSLWDKGMKEAPKSVRKALNAARKEFFKGKMNKAMKRVDKLLSDDPNMRNGLFLKASFLMQLQRPDEAVTIALAAAMQGNQQDFEAWQLAGDCYQQTGDFGRAATCYDKAAAIDKNNAQLQFSLGNSLNGLGSFDGAVAAFRRAVTIKPGYYEAWNNMGTAYMSLAKYAEAIDALRKTVQLIPDHPTPLLNLAIMEWRVCEWDLYEKRQSQLSRALDTRLKQGKDLMTPFHSFEFGFTPKQIKDNAVAYSKGVMDRVAHISLRNQELVSLHPQRPLTVGYLSATGFTNTTTTTRAISPEFAMHDRSFLRVLCFSAKPSDGTPERKEIEDGCDEMIDVSNDGFESMTVKIRNKAVDVLVDLTGYTINPKAEVFALRAAPIQISWHGFPGTSGANFFDILATDKIAATPDMTDQFTEYLGMLPVTYLHTAHKLSRTEVLQPGAQEAMNRKDFGFKQDQTIFCSFNQLYKLTPNLFEAWLEILSKVPDSVLWLLKFDSSAPAKLRKRAELYGIDSNRLVFLDMLPKESEFLAKGLADLFLDSPVFNAHTTATDVLWSAVPMLTLPGENMAQRVASSMVLHSHSAPLVVRNMQEYIRMAVSLGNNRQRLKRLKTALRKQRTSSDVFDLPCRAQDLGRLYMMTAEVADANQGDMMHIVVSQRDCGAKSA